MIGKHICTNVNDTKKSLKLFSELPKTNSARIFRPYKGGKPNLLVE